MTYQNLYQQTNNSNLNFTRLQLLLMNDELHYIDSQFYHKELLQSHHEFVLYEYTVDCWSTTLSLLDSNNIEYSIHTDKFNLDFILI